MAITKLPDALKEIKDRIEGQWDNTNTAIGSDPHFGFGWFNRQNDEPQVTVFPREDSKTAGGYQYMTSGGGGIEYDSEVQIHFWLHRKQIPSGDSSTLNDQSVNPRQLAHEFGQEVDRIIIDDPFAITEYQWMAPAGLTMLAESEQSPTIWHYVKRVTARMRNDPA